MLSFRNVRYAWCVRAGQGMAERLPVEDREKRYWVDPLEHDESEGSILRQRQSGELPWGADSSGTPRQGRRGSRAGRRPQAHRRDRGPHGPRGSPPQAPRGTQNDPLERDQGPARPLRRYRVEFLPSALKEFEALATPQRRKAARHIDSLADNPRSAGYKALEGRSKIYRIRSGDYRIVYQIRDEVLVVLIIRVAHRSDVYKRLPVWSA